MRLHTDFAERGKANSVHGMNAEGDVVNCFRTAESTRIGGCMRPNKVYTRKSDMHSNYQPPWSWRDHRQGQQSGLVLVGLNGVEHNEHLR